MQAVIVHPAADYAAVSPSLPFSAPPACGAFSPPQSAPTDGSRKSFDEMISEAGSESHASLTAPEAELPSDAAVREPDKRTDRLSERQAAAGASAERTDAAAPEAEGQKMQKDSAPRNVQKSDRLAVRAKGADGRKAAAVKGRGLPAKKSLEGDAGVVMQEGGAADAAQVLGAPAPAALPDGAAGSGTADVLNDRPAHIELEASVAAAALSVPASAAAAPSNNLEAAPADAEGERGSNGRTEGTSRARRFALDSEGTIVITDLRTEQRAVQAAGAPQEGGARVIDADGAGGAELTVEFAAAAGADAARQNILSGNGQTAGASSSTFQAMLSNQIQQNAGELVRAGSIVLRDNDAGSIKLVLHPESLGSVKIDLQISGRDITGRIMVASQEAYNAFKESAETLRHAFMQSGFENAGFDVAFSGSGSQNAASNGFGQDGRGASRFAMAQTYGSLAAGSDDGASDAGEIIGLSAKNAVNIVA